MIISFTGVQSSGKSTLLDKMKLDGDFKTYNFVPEITRRLKKQYDLNINEDGDEFTQLAILNSHVHNYLTHRKGDAVLDRCILDGFLYTTYMFYKNRVPEALVLHSSYLFEKLIKKYDILFYTEPDIPLEDDGERSIDIEFRNKMTELFEECIDHYKLNVIRLKGSVNDRYDKILDTVNNYGK